eukprot:scaffold40750_cov168-Amphora_coffeaeformis.AAC.2
MEGAARLGGVAYDTPVFRCPNRGRASAVDWSIGTPSVVPAFGPNSFPKGSVQACLASSSRFERSLLKDFSLRRTGQVGHVPTGLGFQNKVETPRFSLHRRCPQSTGQEGWQTQCPVRRLRIRGDKSPVSTSLSSSLQACHRTYSQRNGQRGLHIQDMTDSFLGLVHIAVIIFIWGRKDIKSDWEESSLDKYRSEGPVRRRQQPFIT